LRKRTTQKRFVFPNGWGGRRKGSGPKPKNGRRSVPHGRRAELPGAVPVHVTMRLQDGLPSFRRGREEATLRESFRRCRERNSFRFVHYTIIDNHLHLIVEASERRDLTRGLTGLATSIAMRLNKLWKRRGKVFDGRYHDHVLRSPREARNVMDYVFHNARKPLQATLTRSNRAHCRLST